jgi:long-chain acyl-CoA synthetase
MMAGRLISGTRELTQQEFEGNAARAAAALTAAGVQPGDAVALMLRNDFPFIEVSLAVRMMGAYPVPINWHATAEEAGYILRDCGAQVFLVHADLLPALRAGMPHGVPVYVVATPPEIAAAYGIEPGRCAVPPGETEWSRWIAGFKPQPLGEIPMPATMIYTSGTTGRPKGVLRKPRTPEEEVIGRSTVVTMLGMTGTVTTVICGPMYHSAPNAYALVAAMLGGTVILQPRFDPEELLQLIATHRVTHLQMVPTMFVRLLKLPEEVRRRYDVSSLQWVIHGAAPCPQEVKRKMIEWWGPVINEFYGATEMGTVSFCTSEEWLAHPGTVGKAAPHAVIRILDAEGKELPPGEPGEVYSFFGGMGDFTYIGDEQKRREVERDGLITCGDIGFLDADGFLYLCDRKRDMVISGGVNIYPAEIEAELLKHTSVADCAVFGIPDEEFGERLCACIQPEPGAQIEAAEVQRFLRQHLAAYKIPKVIEFRDALPREDSGKILKRKLRAPYWEQAGRRI